MNHQLPPRILPSQLKAYLQQHAKQNPAKPWLWKVHTDLPVFKKVYEHRYYSVIANLIIPKGATIRAGTSSWRHPKHKRKMRANRAMVHSLVTRDTHEQTAKAHSNYAINFEYVPGKVVRPKKRFDWDDVECSTGIHFFLELKDAFLY